MPDHEYNEDHIAVRPIDDSVYAAIDLTRESFEKNLARAVSQAIEFARSLVKNALPSKATLAIGLNLSFDENPLVEDEKIFPEDSGRVVETESFSEAANLLWRQGLVPEWIDVTVAATSETSTRVELRCCGRFTATPKLLYHVRQGNPPFHVIGPYLPPGHSGGKFDLHWPRHNQSPEPTG